jgi:uncharacterized protein (TIGR03435 family)
VLRDEVRREVEVEVGYAHCFILWKHFVRFPELRASEPYFAHSLLRSNSFCVFCGVVGRRYVEITRITLEDAIRYCARYTAVALLAVGLCVSVHAQTDGRSYDAATIKPSDPDHRGQSWHDHNNRVGMENVTLRQLIKVAYDFRSDSQVIGGPEWIGKKRFDISARMDDEEFARYDKMPPKEQEKESHLLLRQLLADHFHLRVKAEARPLPQFDLVVDGGGTKLVALPTEGTEGGENLSVHNSKGNAYVDAKGVSMESLVAVLSDMPEVGTRVVLNHTGLTGAYTFQLKWTPDNAGGATDEAATAPGLFTAVKEQLGLRLERGEGDVPVVVVEQADLPQFD